MIQRPLAFALLAIALLLPGCKKAVPAAPPAPKGLSITKAVWGWPLSGSMADVTVLLGNLVVNGELSTTADIAVLGDPAPSKSKRLLVEYSQDGVPCRKTVEEFAPLQIKAGEPPSRLRLRIVKATYGDHAGGQIKDVTTQVAGLVSNNLLRVTATNAIFGDPAERKTKELHVEYTWDSATKTQIAKEAEELNLGEGS